jgi:WD40 repeat protein
MPRQIMPVRNNTVPRPTLSPDGTLVAVLDGGPGIHLFDRASGKELRTLGDKESFNQCRFTPDGQRVVGVRNRDTPIAIGFDLDGKELFRREPEGTQIGEWDRRLVFYAIVPGAAVAEKPGSITLRVVDVETGKELRKFETTADDYYVEPQDKGFRTGLRDSTLSQNRIAIAPDQSSIAYLRADRSLGILSLTPGSKPRAAELPEQFIPGRIWYGPDGKNLFASNWGGAIVRINPADGKRITTFSGHGNGVGQWHVDAEGKVMTTTGQDGLIARWDLTTNKEIPLATGGFRSQVRVAITADGKRVIAGDRGGIIEVCSAEGKPLYSIPGSDSEWTTFALSPDGRTLVVTRAQSTLLWWDLVAGKELAKSTIPGPIPDQLFKSIHEMAFTPDGRRLICSYQNATLVALDTETRKELWRVGPPTDKDYDSSVGLAVSSDGRHIARGLRRGVRTGDWGYGLQIVDSATGEALKNIDVSEQRQSYGLPSLSEIRYTSDGRYLILLSINGHVQVRYADTLAEFASFTTGAKHAGALNVSPDGRTIVTGDDTGGTKLWETLTGKLIATVSGHRGGVYSTAISPNGPYLVTGGVDRVAYVWKLKPTTPLTAKAIEQLSSDDAAAAREAIWTLAADPDGPKKLREHIKPFEHPKPDAIQGLIADLDHPMFARREEASKALSDLGVFVEPAIRKALSEKPTAEARERLEKVRKGIDRKPTRIDLLHSRAVHAVELANTEAARKVLEEWAGGAAGAWLTVDAKAALERLRRMK